MLTNLLLYTVTIAVYIVLFRSLYSSYQKLNKRYYTTTQLTILKIVIGIHFLGIFILTGMFLVALVLKK